MRVLMLSLDKTLLGEQIGAWQGDTVNRHKFYGELVEKLDILVTAPKGYEPVKLSERVDVHPSNAGNAYAHKNAALKLAEKLHENHGLDLVVAQDLTAPAALMIRKKLGVPFIVTFHGADFDSPEWNGSLKKKVILYFVKKAVMQADGLRVVSPKMKKYFEELGYSGAIEVIPTPSDYTLFTKETSVPEFANWGSTRIILADGRLEKVKNYPLLFEAFKKVRKKIESIKLFIIGGGSLEKELKKLAQTKEIETDVVWLGTMAYDKLPAYYQRADVFVLASDSESLGKVLLQAGAAGKPVVATKTLGASSIIKNGETGYLVDIGSASELSDKILKLLSDEDLRHRQGQAARQHVLENYNPEKNVRKLIGFWQEVAGNKKTHQS